MEERVKTRKRFRPRDGGFTLLEVVVAMAIVGLGVVTLLEIFSLGLRLTARSSERTEVVLRGRELMDRFLAEEELVDQTEHGSFDGKYSWRIRVSPHERKEATELKLGSNWELKEVHLEMRYGSFALGERYLEMSTLRLVKKKGS